MDVCRSFLYWLIIILLNSAKNSTTSLNSARNIVSTWVSSTNPDEILRVRETRPVNQKLIIAYQYVFEIGLKIISCNNQLFLHHSGTAIIIRIVSHLYSCLYDIVEEN